MRCLETYVASLLADIFGILIVDAADMGFVTFSSGSVGFVFFTGVETDRSCDTGFVDVTPILLGLACRESTEEDGVGLVSPGRSLLVLL